jgi:hypothetical protein
MARISTLGCIQVSSGERILGRNQKVFWWNRSAIPSARQNMEHKAQPEPAAAALAGAPDLIGPAGDASAADLTTPNTREIQNSTESGSQLIWSGNVVHEKYFVA